MNVHSREFARREWYSGAYTEREIIGLVIENGYSSYDAKNSIIHRYYQKWGQ